MITSILADRWGPNKFDYINTILIIRKSDLWIYVIIYKKFFDWKFGENLDVVSLCV